MSTSYTAKSAYQQMEVHVEVHKSNCMPYSNRTATGTEVFRFHKLHLPCLLIFPESMKMIKEDKVRYIYISQFIAVYIK